MNLIRSSMTALLAALSFAAHAAPSATDIVRQADIALWGEKSWIGEAELTVVRPEWTRSMGMKVWVNRSPAKTFTRITSPAKEAGSGSLQLGSEMWNYVPSIERTVKIPPSMALQPWMGSDFTNDDVMRQGSLLSDYVHRLVGETTLDGTPAYELELKPKPEAVVTWGRIALVVRRADMAPLRETYFDERGNLVRELKYGEFRSLGGRAVPTQWVMTPANKPGRSTVIRIKSASFDSPISDDVFSLRHLTKKE